MWRGGLWKRCGGEAEVGPGSTAVMPGSHADSVNGDSVNGRHHSAGECALTKSRCRRHASGAYHIRCLRAPTQSQHHDIDSGRGLELLSRARLRAPGAVRSAASQWCTVRAVHVSGMRDISGCGVGQCRCCLSPSDDVRMNHYFCRKHLHGSYKRCAWFGQPSHACYDLVPCSMADVISVCTASQLPARNCSSWEQVLLLRTLAEQHWPMQQCLAPAPLQGCFGTGTGTGTGAGTHTVQCYY